MRESIEFTFMGGFVFWKMLCHANQIATGTSPQRITISYIMLDEKSRNGLALVINRNLVHFVMEYNNNKTLRQIYVFKHNTGLLSNQRCN